MEYEGLYRTYHVLNLGAGVQSTCVQLLFNKGLIKYNDKVIKLDCSIFADTQEESKFTYEHLNWLIANTPTPIWVRSRGKLGNDLVKGMNSTGQRFISIPAFTMADGDTKPSGIVRRQCTSEYKIDVIESTIRKEVLNLKSRQRMPKDAIIYEYFGISLDEARRTVNIKDRINKFGNSKARFPLLDLCWTRQNCVSFNNEHIPHKVPRSACVFCPYRSDSQWKDLKETDPEGFARAVEIDNALRIPGNYFDRSLNHTLYVHKSGKPLSEVEFKEDKFQLPSFIKECEGMCGI